MIEVINTDPILKEVKFEMGEEWMDLNTKV
jgi:hypothetical protein